MFKNDIHLRSELAEIVDVYTADGASIAKGELNIGPNKAPLLELNNFYDIGNIGTTAFKACSHNGTWYTLLDCTVYEFGRIFPKIVVKSDSHSGDFKKIKFVVQGLSQWFDNSKFTDSGDGHITKYLNTNKFNTSISDESLGNIAISSENWWQTHSEKDGRFAVSQKTAICVEPKDATFTCDGVIDHVNRVKNLLSILIGYPLSIEYCFDVRDRKRSSIYFVNFQEDKQKFENQIECLVRASYLFSENRWDTVFKNAFETNKDNFINIWSRLPGLSDFSKYWEYELLACVSLTDRYASVFSKVTDNKIPKKQFSNIRKCLENSVNSYVRDNASSNLNQDVITSIIQQIEFIKNTKYPSFQSCFEFTYNSMSADFRNIINLSEEDFGHLKNLRNKIAHGDTPTTKHDSDLTHEMTLQSKLLVILYCWALRDFGIPEIDCIHALGNWMHPMIRSADLNKTALDKTIGHYKFLPLTKQDFTRAEKVKLGPIVLEFIGKGKNYKYRKDMEEMIKDWYIPAREKPRNLCEYIALHVDTKNIQSLCYVGSAYIKNGDQLHCTRGVCILNPPNELIDKMQFWRYDTTTKKWHQSLEETPGLHDPTP